MRSIAKRVLLAAIAHPPSMCSPAYLTARVSQTYRSIPPDLMLVGDHFRWTASVPSPTISSTTSSVDMPRRIPSLAPKRRRERGGKSRG